MIESQKTTKGIKIYSGYNFISLKDRVINKGISFVAEKENFYAHGITIKKAISDVQFKIVAEKLKNDPIKKDTKFTVKYYRLLTGACSLGCKSWLDENNIKYTIIEKEPVEVSPIKAIDLLELLIKTNAYGLEKFRALCDWL